MSFIVGFPCDPEKEVFMKIYGIYEEAVYDKCLFLSKDSVIFLF